MVTLLTNSAERPFMACFTRIAVCVLHIIRNCT